MLFVFCFCFLFLRLIVNTSSQICRLLFSAASFVFCFLFFDASFLECLNTAYSVFVFVFGGILLGYLNASHLTFSFFVFGRYFLA